ncbi:efflux RND transporter periplasmic adaptor subunit [Fontimonas thermophila]|uniref:efflux RND transporter periplasmic adaptor subunit n=1 Tax=Fontimonas thermophila TaxID=1076937 RepID=UPI00190EA0C5|nr:efflux RND transporter periplasmic adaptor subunit [Fontimonas thermophila]
MITLLAGCSGESPGAAEAPARVTVPVEVHTVSARPLAHELVAVGSIRADESVVVRPEIAGRIAHIGFAEGQAVKAGQLLFALDDAIYRAELDQARASLVLAQRNFERATELFARKLVAQAERDQAAAAFDAAKAAMALAQARLDKTRILAPFSGVAGLRQVSPGDYVAPGQDLVHLQAMDRVKVDLRIDESALPMLRVGQTLAVEVDAYPGERFSGEVYAIDPRIADTTRSIALRARLPNPEGRLRPGQFARVRLVLGHKADAIVIPEQAIFPRGERQFVYVVDDGSARLREIRVGLRIPGEAEVLDGLRAGERLIIAGLQRLSDGTPVHEQ